MWAPEGSKTEIIEEASKKLKDYLLQDEEW